MSSFEISALHVDAILTAGLRLDPTRSPITWWFPAPDAAGNTIAHGSKPHELTTETAGRVGALLLLENRRSINARYRRGEWEQPYVFAELSGTPDALTTLKAVDCYEHQSCDHDEWEASEAYQFCQALRLRAILCLPGYDLADGWPISTPAVFQRARA